MSKVHVKTGDTVVVLSGKNKGQRCQNKSQKKPDRFGCHTVHLTADFCLQYTKKRTVLQSIEKNYEI